jgi:hypothetical protein
MNDLLGNALWVWHWLAGPQLAVGVGIGIALLWLVQKVVGAFLDRRAEDYKHRHTVALQNEKARLDLYNRRFEILSSLYDFYDAMISWTSNPDSEQIAARKRFHRASQEAEFLFTKESGIAALLNDLNRQGQKVIGFKENKESFKSDPATMLAEFSKTQEIMLRGFDDGLTKLKTAMHPYLDFTEM